LHKKNHFRHVIVMEM